MSLSMALKETNSKHSSLQRSSSYLQSYRGTVRNIQTTHQIFKEGLACSSCRLTAIKKNSQTFRALLGFSFGYKKVTAFELKLVLIKNIESFGRHVRSLCVIISSVLVSTCYRHWIILGYVQLTANFMCLLQAAHTEFTKLSKETADEKKLYLSDGGFTMSQLVDDRQCEQTWHMFLMVRETGAWKLHTESPNLESTMPTHHTNNKSGGHQNKALREGDYRFASFFF